jgi:NADPH-dependent 2,4-dienoyl-CoA reductase/sulfur reductase-like enzyme
MKIVIIGGVATGMSAATRARRLDEHAEITVYEKSGHVSYANCGLPYYLGGVIGNRESLLLQTPHSLHSRFKLNVFVKHEVIEINAVAKSVEVRNLSTGEVFVDYYDKLVIATGAKPNLLDIPGIERAVPLRNIEDADLLKAQISGDDKRRAVILGAGFVGIETAENLHQAGFEVTIVTPGFQILSSFDPEIVEPFQARLVASGIQLKHGVTASEITDDAVTLTDGSVLPASVVVNAAGVKPNTRLAEKAQLKLGAGGGIWVDGNQRTSDGNIYAGGDAALKITEFQGEDALIPLANLANRHGRAIADAIYGVQTKSSKSIGTAIIGAFGLTLAMTGLTEKNAKNYSVIHLHPSNHAGYYPDSKPISLKVLFDSTSGKILGAQALGEDGVDKRIDVIATAIKGNLTISDLMDLELSYAPQYGSAKDAINQAGYVGNNVFTGITPTIQWHELDEYISSGWALVDVRTQGEHSHGSIPGSTNIPVDELRNRISLLQGKKVLVHCQVGQRGHTATQILRGFGVEVRNLDGGYKTWRSAMDARKRKEG